MKKILVLTAMAATVLCADMMNDLAKDAMVTEGKSKVRDTAVRQIAGDDEVKKVVVNKAADKVLGKEKTEDKIKAKVFNSIMGK